MATAGGFIVAAGNGCDAAVGVATGPKTSCGEEEGAELEEGDLAPLEAGNELVWRSPVTGNEWQSTLTP